MACAISGDLGGFRCPRCEAEIGFDYSAKLWAPDLTRAMEEWHKGEDAQLPCAACGVATILDAWNGEPDWAVGRVGFQFWNWPPLADEFIADLRAALGAPRLWRVQGKL